MERFIAIQLSVNDHIYMYIVRTVVTIRRLSDCHLVHKCKLAKLTVMQHRLHVSGTKYPIFIRQATLCTCMWIKRNDRGDFYRVVY